MNDIFGMSETGRKLRKDSFEAKHDMNLIEQILKKLYLDDMLSTTKIPLVMKNTYNINISSVKCFQIIKRLGILRNKSESISLAVSSLDYNKTFLTKEIENIINGIVIGDGYIYPNFNTKTARLSISGSKKEFIDYCGKLLKPYAPSESSYIPPSNPKLRDGIGIWHINTKFHPDLFQMYLKWYPNNKKQIYENINLDPITVLLWYLGDGSLSSETESNSKSLYFSTNLFKREDIENILVKKFIDLGIETSRITFDNRLFIKTSSIPKLLNYMGGKSPVECYSYKFYIEDWRTKKTMKDVSKELNIKYDKLANWVKTGFVQHSRSPMGKKVLFSDQELEELKSRIESGELPLEKGRKAKKRSESFSKIEDIKIIKNPNESNDDYIFRIVETYQKKGFPYKNYSEDKLKKEWYSLVKSQYIIPECNIIKWRRNGLSLADSFHKHIFELHRKNKISPIDLFKNKDLFIDCLKNHCSINGVLTYAGIHCALCGNVKSPRLNNFPPLIARDIFNYYCKDGYRIIDPCSGFSGRLIGASVSKRNIEYTGIDPSTKTYYGLINTKQFIQQLKPEFKCNIIHGCAESELNNFTNESFDFCLSSPPYFDTEHYSNENTQSHIKYNSYDKWRNDFLNKILKEIFRILKNDRYTVINIGKFGKYNISEDIIKLSENIGFKIKEIKYISFPIYKFVDSEENERLEPAIVLYKN